MNNLPGDFHNTFIWDFLNGVVVENQNYSENKANKQMKTGQDKNKVQSKSNDPRQRPRRYLEFIESSEGIVSHTFKNPVLQ